MSTLRTAFTPPSTLKGVFAGAGSDGLNAPAVANTILRLTGKSTPDVHVVYIGTATYDLPGPRERQTQRFVDAGCTVTALDVTQNTPDAQHMQDVVGSADTIIVSGGNTLFAVDRCGCICAADLHVSTLRM